MKSNETMVLHQNDLAKKRKRNDNDVYGKWNNFSESNKIKRNGGVTDLAK